MSLNVDSIANEAGTGPVELTSQEAPKAFLKFDMSDGVIDISLNFSSTVDQGTGSSDVLFTNAMTDSDYVKSGSGTDSCQWAVSSITASQFRIVTRDNAGTATDKENISAIVIGDLA